MQQVGVRGRVEKVLGVVVMRKERDRPGNEMRGLIGVVAVGQSLLDPPQAQAQRDRKQQPQERAMQIAAAPVYGPHPSTATAAWRWRRHRKPTGWLGRACRCRVHLHIRVSRYRVMNSAPARSIGCLGRPRRGAGWW